MGDYGTSQKCCAADANHSKLLCILYEASRWIRFHWADHVMHVINKTRLAPQNSNLNCDTCFMSLYRKNHLLQNHHIKHPHVYFNISKTSKTKIHLTQKIMKNPSGCCWKAPPGVPWDFCSSPFWAPRPPPVPPAAPRRGCEDPAAPPWSFRGARISSGRGSWWSTCQRLVARKNGWNAQKKEVDPIDIMLGIKDSYMNIGT